MIGLTFVFHWHISGGHEVLKNKINFLGLSTVFKEKAKNSCFVNISANAFINPSTITHFSRKLYSPVIQISLLSRGRPVNNNKRKLSCNKHNNIKYQPYIKPGFLICFLSQLDWFPQRNYIES